MKKFFITEMAKKKSSNSLETGRFRIEDGKKTGNGEKPGIIFKKPGKKKKQIFRQKILGRFLKAGKWRKNRHQFLELEKMASFGVSKIGNGEKISIIMVFDAS